ncbi:MAG: hypothetical protein EOR11_19850 [Mesorhizobium sp.]|uniref:hypothetical protein n=1 Tax=Mesorhizobium sp. TaxID=1871066 RepID=UPI000FE4C128|nr:hypothetical protein [Mesorhizobium sp.]RWP84716.1 MAG: hypothetical protein EOR11_19850 [Mesorhizobium sp.]
MSTTQRGTGQDRRPLIIIDGRNYKRHYGTATSGTQVASRMAAKRLAFELAMGLGELLGLCMIMASIVLFAVAMGG